MKKILPLLLFLLPSVRSWSQTAETAFNTYLTNDEYEVYLRIDFYNESVTVPGNELYGQLPGFLGKKNNSFCWAITSATVTDERKATLSLINDFGSEDLTATLTRENDTLYVLRQESGSALKVPRNGKWQKLPRQLPFIRKQPRRPAPGT